MNKKFFFAGLFIILFSLFFITDAKAAVLSISLVKNTFNVGDQFTADVKLDTENVGINAAQATIQFRTDMLEVVSYDKTGSIFNFWLEEPTFSNQNGALTFIGGTTTGYSGKTLQILRINFKIKGAGTSDMTFIDAAATASDGSGTNVLSKVIGVTIISTTQGIMPPMPMAIAPPTQISRPAVPAVGLPAKPNVSIPLYPDPTLWYNVSSKFTVQWNLPADITDVATAINKDPTSAPLRAEGLFDNKTFEPLSDGTWYLHVRFANNIGWGPTTHWRIAIDTVPPIPFTLQVSPGLSTDNPTPKLTYFGGDALSGIDHYSIRIDDNDPIITDTDTFALPPQPPAKHLIRVAAFDKAGNSTENSATIEILPIASPVITSAPTIVILGESITISGTALPNEKVRVFIKNSASSVVNVKDAAVDNRSNWRAEFTETVPSGNYYAEVITIDNRGAQSLIVKSKTIEVIERPLLTFGGISITTSGLFLFIIFILLVGTGINYLSTRLIQKQLARKVAITERDVNSIFELVKKELNKALDNFFYKKLDEAEISETKQLIKHAVDYIEKTRGYILENIEELKKTPGIGLLQIYNRGYNILVDFYDTVSEFITKLLKKT